MKRISLFFALALTSAPALAADAPLPRTVIALYEDKNDGDIRTTLIHSMAEMPLNHLGLMVEYHSISEPLPDLDQRPDVRGVITWFSPETRMENPKAYLAWAGHAVDIGKRFVLLGHSGAAFNRQEQPVALATINRFLGRLGLTSRGRWNEASYHASYRYNTPEMFFSATPFEGLHPIYELMALTGTGNEVHLTAQDPTIGETPLLVTGPHGGYASPYYLFRSYERKEEERRQWMIDALEFFRLAFATDDLPKPDTTTLAGRRIYYSHIDGDGWNNVSAVESYRDRGALSSEVIQKEAIEPYPGLPVTVTIIGAEIDPDWTGKKNSRQVAESVMALPNVEAGSHTYSHPFQWQFFKDGNWQKELPYLSRYPFGHWDPKALGVPETNPTSSDALTKDPLMQGYHVPRAYANKPFDLNMEVKGSIEEVAALLPKDKKVELLTWPGNCSPWDAPIHLTREAGVQNINGGDSRYDNEYPTYASLAPIGKQVGAERQIYASMSNENTYTSLWSKNYHAYRDLVQTLKNSEFPIRFKPLNIYYHIYTGEKRASLSALLGNLAYASQQDIAPITASHFTRIAESFYRTELVPAGANAWKILNRGALQTIRFDRATDKSVEFAASHGVIGQRHFQGSLYVYLDAEEKNPLITLKDTSPVQLAEEENAYLVESRWGISNLKRSGRDLRFTAEGYGDGEMVWQLPPGSYRIRAGDTDQTVETDGRLLKFTIKQNAIAPLTVSIQRLGHA